MKSEYQKAYEKRTSYAANIRYQKENMRRIALMLNRNTDADIIEKLESEPNKSGYIKQLIRDDIRQQ